MPKIVAGYFDSEDDATRAMDTLLKDPAFRDAESEVISNQAGGTGSPGVVGAVPFIPNTTAGGSGNQIVGPVAVTGGGRRLFDDLGDREAEYFNSAMRDGRGVLALMKVEDQQATHVSRVFSQNGARTYQE
jgi:hypothetical protein